MGPQKGTILHSMSSNLELGQSPESAGNGDYARIGFRYYSADYAAIIPIILPFFLKGEDFF